MTQSLVNGQTCLVGVRFQNLFIIYYLKTLESGRWQSKLQVKANRRDYESDQWVPSQSLIQLTWLDQASTYYLACRVDSRTKLSS